MGRKPVVRDNYRQDAITLNRIIGAIELDESSSLPWKETVKRHLAEAMRLMLQHSVENKTKRAV